MMSEKIELLGKNIYTDIPGELTLKPFPTVTELDYVSSEDFEKTMLDDIFPECIEEKVNFRKLLEIDFYWICRAFRFLNYGPFHTVNAILCDNCGRVDGECQVDLRAIECKVLPDNFSNDIVLTKDRLIDYDKDIHLHLLTIQEAIDLRKDKMFFKKDGTTNNRLARICYSITSMGGTKMTPVTARLEVTNKDKMSAADYKVLTAEVIELTDFGLRGGGRCTCPKCHDSNAAFITLVDDRFFRPSVGDIRKGRSNRSIRGDEVPTGNKAEVV